MDKTELVGNWDDLSDYDISGYEMNLDKRGKGVITFLNWGFCWALRFRWDYENGKILLTDIKRYEEENSENNILNINDAYIQIEKIGEKLQVVDTNLQCFCPEIFSKVNSE